MQKSAKTRRLLLVVAAASLVIVSGFLFYRFSPWARSLFEHDGDNPAELAKLGEAKLLVAPVANPSIGWPQWRGPLRDGRAPEGKIRTDWDKNPPKTLWQTPCGGSYSSLAVVGGKVYTQDRQGTAERVICLDAGTGKQLWEYAYPADYTGMDRSYATGPRANPSIEGNRIYTVGAAGKLICLESPPPGGQPKLLWEHDLLGEFQAPLPQWGVASSPLVEGGLVIVQPGGKTGAVAAFDRDSGQLRWTVGANLNGYSSPIAATVGGRRIVYALMGDALLCIDPSAGRLLSSYSWKTNTDFIGNIATPIVVDDYVFISSNYNKGCALLHAVPAGDSIRLEEVYARSNRVMRNHHSSCIYRDGYLYGFDNDKLKCVDFRKGIEQADWEATKLDKGCLISTDRYLIVLTERGDLALVEADPEEFHLLGKLPKILSTSNTWALPALVDGRLYLRDGKKIVCLDIAVQSR